MAVAMYLCAAWCCEATTYYINAAKGNDANPGTSPETAFQTLERASKVRLQAGDQLLLAAGQKFAGQLAYKELSGAVGNPILISSYPFAEAGDDSRARIDARGFVAGVLLKNCGHIEIRNLQITANAGGMKPGQTVKPELRCGILVVADKAGSYEGFSLTNVVVKDVFFEDPGFVRAPEEAKSANGTQNYGWGIRFMVNASGAVMRDISIVDCQIENVSHTGLKFTAPSNGLENLNIQRVKIMNSGGPGVQMSGVRGGHFSELDVNRSGSTNDTRNWSRGSGLWTWGSSDVVIEKSRFQNANGPGDSAGVHIDYKCRNVIVQYNFSANNAGGFCEILGNNYNCAYRYNVSVNDGYRVKGQNGAFQEGKIFWLSGFTGSKSPRQGPFNTYFYNNTIYVGDDSVAKVSVAPTARGVLVANNIFYFKGRSESVVGDQERPDSGRATAVQNVGFKNNLFLRPDNWPTKSLMRDELALVGDPEFKNASGWSLTDYVPRNAGLVKGKGIPISKIPNDEVGLIVGLHLERDILGNKILGLPDIGAIEMP